ncbi:hypothetical protein [Amaricoccus solimangrovi]|uniref:Uncharacterized protein n=1 Tax=Amaricoccus solimangrovi TaxID=2589815 RepID=A0A501WLV2_9RHOB|nr:hypothetical protein [Amaricoccus solimangrovi]TPE50459.1 hypothetical protein FJM51_11735 [Amaricoccus solimangrovi]
MNDEALIRVALRAALDHILELDGERPLTDAEWDERPDADPELFSALVSAGHVALSTARACGATREREVPARHLRVGPGKRPGHLRVQHLPTGAVVEVSHLTPQVDASLALGMVRAAFEQRA